MRYHFNIFGGLPLCVKIMFQCIWLTLTCIFPELAVDNRAGKSARASAFVLPLSQFIDRIMRYCEKSA